MAEPIGGRPPPTNPDRDRWNLLVRTACLLAVAAVGWDPTLVISIPDLGIWVLLGR